MLQDPKRSQEYLHAIWQAIPNQEPDDACPPSLAKIPGGKRLNFFERGLRVHASANTLDQALEQACTALKRA